MRSGGIDLSTDPRKTGVATIEWYTHGARLASASLGADDDSLVELIDHADRTGIDCPLGWPTAFVDYVVAHRDGGLDLDVPPTRAPLLLRATDRHVVRKAGVRPLSVSAERIGSTAMRCAALLSRLVEAGTAVDRTGGSGAVVETYPAAALKIWQLPFRSYKGRTTEAQAVRAKLVEGLATALPWLDLGGHENVCREHDDVLDAVVCALVAGLVLLDRCDPVPPDAVQEARTEGWIALPPVIRPDGPAVIPSVRPRQGSP
ncbi:DUF429 domain-containing protein [Isoptericola halotolerans]|uniref:Nuclease with RNAse H fold n=1 Tax=Isoptericola halotolerans TaxID=300560 RepID=A0ABX2A8X2_9MICO|nr:DUF429 domain-containing protein [Isoptericola halotolerans]NOV99099.1 putative nuclease with RNAse H fold [Isoptericola halotolerans]